MNYQKYIEKEKARIACLNIFSALLCQPAENVADNPEVYKKLHSAIKIAVPGCEKDVTRLQETTKHFTTLNLLVEYTRLFIGPVAILVHPYSCLYFGAKHLMSDETMWVINFYSKAGLKFDTGIKDAPDHIVVETEFLYYLAFNEIKELEDENMDNARFYRECQSEFFHKHYKIWVPEFCRKIKENTKNEYYTLLADCLNRFVSNSELSELPSPISKNFQT